MSTFLLHVQVQNHMCSITLNIVMNGLASTVICTFACVYGLYFCILTSRTQNSFNLFSYEYDKAVADI